MTANPSDDPEKTLVEIGKRQHWKADTATFLKQFIGHIQDRSKYAIPLTDAYNHLDSAADTISLIEGAPPGLHGRIKSIQHELMGEKPPELTWDHWRNWNICHFLRGKNRWTDLADLLQIVAGQYVTPDSLRVEFHRLKAKYGSLPLDHRLAVHLDRLRGHRHRSRLTVLADRSAFPRLQLAIKRTTKRPAR